MPHFMSISLNTMSLSLPFSFCSLNRSLRSHRSIPKHPQVRSQFRDDQGKSANIVDANLSILTERIEELRTKESLNKCVMAKNNIGWNYQYNYEHNKTKSKDCLFAAESLKFLGFTSGVLGLVFLGGTLCICFVSLLVQLTK